VRAFVALALLAGCGRIAFDPLANTGGSGSNDGGSTGDGPFTGVTKTLHLDKLGPGQPLVDFPLPVILDDTRVDRTRFASDLSDLRFYDSGGNVLSQEIEQAGAPGGAPTIVWVRVPTITGITTTIDVEYGAPARATNMMSVWNSDYIAVWHFGANLGADSTGQHDLTSVGAVASAGALGGGVALNGSQYLTLADTTAIAPTTITVSALLNVPTIPGGYYAVVAREVGATSDDDIYLGLQGNMVLGTCEHANTEYDAFAGPATTGQWMYLSTTATSARIATFLDANQGVMVAVPGALQMGTNPLFVGGDSNGGGTTPQNDFLVGTIDEVRIVNVTRSGPWLGFESAALRDQVITY
jgi:hypothetical protein